jgi:hypothetical protein
MFIFLNSPEREEWIKEDGRSGRSSQFVEERWFVDKLSRLRQEKLSRIG